MPNPSSMADSAIALPHVLDLRHLLTRARMLAATDDTQIMFDRDAGVKTPAAIVRRHRETAALVAALRTVCDAPGDALPTEPLELMLVPPDGAVAERWVRIRPIGAGAVKILPTPVTGSIGRAESVYLMYLATQVLAARIAEESGEVPVWPLVGGE